MAYALAARLERAVKRAGVKYKKVSGWASRGHGSMGSIRGIVAHHTAGPKSGNSPSLNVVAYGRPGLSGPLAQLFLARDGTVYLVAAGVSYHAGRVNNSNFTNSHALGIEAENTGLSNDSPWPAHQVDAYAKLCKALCDEFGLSTSRVRGHKEVCSPRGRKIDPTLNMSQFRKKVGGAKGGVSSGGGTSGGSSKSYESASAKHEVGSRVMGKYDGGSDVYWLQRRLYKLGYDIDPRFDKLFGPNVEKAVRAFQRDAKITVDGLAGKDTIAAAKAAKVKRNLPSKPKHKKPSKSKAPKFPLPKGYYFGPKSGPKSSVSGYYSHRSDLKRWQQRMKDRGWSITPDGLYGPRTATVARKFQAEKKLAVDSLIGKRTWDAAWEAPVT